MNVRKKALSLLLDWEEQKTYINLSVTAAARDLAPKDRAFLTALVYGTVERKLTLDYLAGAFSDRSPAELDPVPRNLLRLGLYQLLYMDGVPAFAAVNETVALARNRGEAGFVNAILREADRRRDRLPLPGQAKNPVRYLSVKYSVPSWIVRRFLADFGEETEELLAACNVRPPLTLAVNETKCRRETLRSAIERAGFPARETPYSPFGVIVDGDAVPASLPGYDDGWFWVQDEASQLSTLALDPRPGDTVIDLCACPGGKSFGAAARMGNCGRVCAYDLHESKLPLVRDGARRLGLSIVAAAPHDATEEMPEWKDRADRVICDVPCSGLGVLAKKPDLRYRDEEGTVTLPMLQYRILDNAARYLKPGGVLLYSTCTLDRAENQEIATRFLTEHPDFCPENFRVGPLASAAGMLMLTPHRHHTDGFFLFRLRRREE